MNSAESPVSGVVVNVKNDAGELVKSITSDRDGQFGIEGLAEGIYYLDYCGS
jgi:hypothetical protein